MKDEEDAACGWQEVPEGPGVVLRTVKLEGPGAAVSAEESEGPGKALSTLEPEGLGIALSAEDWEGPCAAFSAVDPGSPYAALSAVEQALGWWFCSLGVIRGWRKGRFSLKDVRTFFVFFLFFSSSDFKILESLCFLSETVMKTTGLKPIKNQIYLPSSH